MAFQPGNPPVEEARMASTTDGPNWKSAGTSVNVTLDEFDFDLDPARIAQQPIEPRDASRLLRLDRATGRTEHCIFRQLPELLQPGDLLVLNDTRVIPARFVCRRATGGRVEGLYLEQPQPRLWEVMLKGAGKCRLGETLQIVGAEASALALRADRGEGRWQVELLGPRETVEVLEAAGATPLPPYIHRPRPEEPAAADRDAADRQRYQTVYSARPGAVAAPTAGLHFTPALLERLAEAGIEQVRLTLHVGMGTFLPVKADRIDGHRMHVEEYDLPAATAEAIVAAQAQGRRVVAVGTTVVRVLETVAATGPVRAARGRTDIFLYPPAPFRAVNALITNFHLPRSTLLMLVAAFCSPGRTDGVAMIQAAYREAIAHDYRFFSYGDAMLIT